MPTSVSCQVSVMRNHRGVFQISRNFRSGLLTLGWILASNKSACNKSSNALSSPNYIYSFIFFVSIRFQPQNFIWTILCSSFIDFKFPVHSKWHRITSMDHFFINSGRWGKLKQVFIRHKKPLVKERKMKMIRVRFLGTRGGGDWSGEGHTTED